MMRAKFLFFEAFTAADIQTAWESGTHEDQVYSYGVWDNEYMVFSYFMDGNPLRPQNFEKEMESTRAATQAVGMLICLAEKKPLPELAAFLKSVTWDELRGAIQDFSHESDPPFEFCPAIGQMLIIYQKMREKEGIKSTTALILDYLIKILWLLAIIALGREAIQEGEIPCD